MPVYTIEGKRVRTEKPLSDDEIDEIASTLRPAQVSTPAPAPPPKLTLPGDRATGFREIVAEAGTPEERLAMAKQIPQYTAALAAPGLVGVGLRALPVARTVLGPLATAVESGGFKSGVAPGASKIADLVRRGVGAGIAGSAATLPFGGEGAGMAAGIGTGLALIAPSLAGRAARFGGAVVDAVKGNLGVNRAGTLLRNTMTPEQVNSLRQAMTAAPEGTLPSRVVAQMGTDFAQDSRQLDILQSILKAAESKAPDDTINALRNLEGQELSNALADIAGGGTATTARATREGAKDALTLGTAPLREEAFAAAGQTNKIVPKLETIAANARDEVAANVGVVRKAERQIASAEEWARSWGVGGARQPGAPIPPVARTYPGELAARAGQVGETAAEASLRAGGTARAAENTLQSVRDRGLEPIKTSNLTSALEAKLKNPEIGTNREASQSITRVSQMLQDWTNANGTITPEALYAIRKNGVAGVIRELNPGMDAKSQDKFAARVLAEIKPLMDDAIVKAGGKTWTQYLNNFEQGMTQIRGMELADQIRKWYDGGRGSAADKQKIVDLIRGESPDVVEDFFGSGKYKISEMMAKDLPFLTKLADTVGLDLKAIQQASKGKAAAVELAKRQPKFPRLKFFTRASTAVNEVAAALEERVSEKTMDTLIKSAQSGKDFNAVIAALPTVEKNAFLSVLNDRTKWNSFATGVATAAAATSPIESSNAMGEENRNNLRQ